MAERGMDATADEIHSQHELRLLMAKADLIAAGWPSVELIFS